MNLDPDIQFVEIDGEKYGYRQSGHGEKVIVLIHGLAETSKYFWRKFISHFKDTYTIIAIDLRGHGDSAKPRKGYRPSEQAKLIFSMLNALNIDQPILLGHSLGGIIAIRFAVMYPDNLSHLVVYDSPLGEGFFKNLSLAFKVSPVTSIGMGSLLIPILGRIFFHLKTPSMMQNLLSGIPVFVDESLFEAELLSESMRNTYEAISQSVWHAVLVENLFKDLPSIKTPTLIIRGEYDNAVPQKSMERAVAQIPKAQLAVIQNAAHLSLIEKPDMFNKAVEQFLL